MRDRRVIDRGWMDIGRRRGVVTIIDMEVNKEGVIDEETSMMMIGCIVGGRDETCRRRIRDIRTI